jgi:hypothetical protein
MANYFTNFSLVLSLPTEAAQAYALEIHHQASCANQGEDLPKDFPQALAGVTEDWQFEVEADGSAGAHGIWLHSENGGIDAVCSFIQHLLEKFDPEGRVTFEWSHDCSKPRTDAYGGGAAIVTAKEIKTMNTGGWLQEQIAQLPASEPLHT